MNINQFESALPGSRRLFKAASPIIYQGEAPRSGFYIKKGIVKSYSLQSNGDEQITGFLGPGDIFPLPWLYEETSISMYYYETIEDAQLISVTRGDITSIVNKNNDILQQLNRKLVRDQAAHLMRVTALEQPRATDKILYTMYYLLYRFGSLHKTQAGVYDISIKLTHSLIASLIGLTRETTAVEINKLRKKGILTYKNKCYSVDKARLERAMGEDTFAELIAKS